MTAAVVMLLADSGHLKLDDPVIKFIPEFKGADRASMTIRHLLTHSSGLPDMLPENEALRKRHAPLRDWVVLTHSAERDIHASRHAHRVARSWRPCHRIY